MTRIHFLLDKLQTALDGHDSLGFILLQQNRPDELVDVGFFVQRGEFILNTLVFLLLRLEFLTGVDISFEFWKSFFVLATCEILCDCGDVICCVSWGWRGSAVAHTGLQLLEFLREALELFLYFGHGVSIESGIMRESR